MNPIKKLNEKVDKFLTDVMKKNEDCTNAELILAFGTCCFTLGCIIMCICASLEGLFVTPIKSILVCAGLLFIGYFVFRMIVGKNQLVSEILKRMDKE